MEYIVVDNKYWLIIGRLHYCYLLLSVHVSLHELLVIFLTVGVDLIYTPLFLGGITSTYFNTKMLYTMHNIAPKYVHITNLTNQYGIQLLSEDYNLAVWRNLLHLYLGSQ